MNNTYKNITRKIFVRLLLLAAAASLLMPENGGAYWLPPPEGGLCWYKADVQDAGTACNCLQISNGNSCSFSLYSFNATCNCGAQGCVMGGGRTTYAPVC